MNRTGIRDILVNALTGMWAHPTVPIYYENTQPLDRNTLPDVFLYCVIDFQNAEQINISPTPHTRYRGYFDVTAYTRETMGTRTLLTHLDELSAFFSYKNLSGVHLTNPGVDVVKPPAGWYGIALSIPFFADSNT